MFSFLLTSAGGPLAAETIRCLKASTRHDVQVIAVDVNEDCLGKHIADVFVPVPKGDHPDYVQTMKDIVSKHEPDLILPCSDEEALALARARDGDGSFSVQLACVSSEKLELMSDKFASYSFLKERGIAVPDFVLVESLDQLVNEIDNFRHDYGELAIKPMQERGGRNVYVIRKDITGEVPYHGDREIHLDYDSFCRNHVKAAAGSFPLIVMERLVEPVYDIDVLSWNGEIKQLFQRQRINPAGVPFEGNISIDDNLLTSLSEEITCALELSWLYDFDIMTAKDGSHRVIEVNPRPSGSLSAAPSCGVNMLDDLISLAKGEPIERVSVEPGIVVRPFTSILVTSS